MHFLKAVLTPGTLAICSAMSEISSWQEMALELQLPVMIGPKQLVGGVYGMNQLRM